MTDFHGVEVARRFRQAGLWGDRLLVDFVDAHARRWPAKPAVIDGRETLTYRELVRGSENVAMGLLRLGVRSGEVVAVQAPNWSELVAAHLALDRIGGLFLPLHEDFREAELEPRTPFSASACAP